MKRFCSDRAGHTAIEYAMIAAFIAALLVASSTQIGETVKGWLDSAHAGFNTGAGG